jgi:hypothetical protein
MALAYLPAGHAQFSTKSFPTLGGWPSFASNTRTRGQGSGEVLSGQKKGATRKAGAVPSVLLPNQ